MGWLVPLGAVLIVIGTAGGAAACYDSSIFDRGSESVAAQMRDQTDAPANASGDDTSRLWLAPMAGLSLAIGLVCVGLGLGHWRRPIPSTVRPANPRSDQPWERGDPPVGLV